MSRLWGSGRIHERGNGDIYALAKYKYDAQWAGLNGVQVK